MGKFFASKNVYSKIIQIFFAVIFSVSICLGQNFKSPQEFGAEVVRFNDIKLLQKKEPKALAKDAADQSNVVVPERLAGYTFKAIAFNEQRGIEKFTRESANTLLKRDLFNAPEYTATYYYSVYDKNAINVESTYIQLVSDSQWDRILYGSLQGTLKSYDDINNPGEIAVNSAGQVFIAERAKSRIVVLQINGKKEEMRLDYLYAIENLGEISSIAYNDGGTPFNLNDDFLFVADAAANTISRIDISGTAATKGTTYKGFRWPVAIAFGRWNGANTNDLYVIDTYEKKLSLYCLDNDDLELLRLLNANQAQSFSTLGIDHFGQVYLADAVNSELFKYTADLQLLDSEKATRNSIIDINIPFGTVDLNGDKYWTGFDQAFVIQKWSDQSGVQRYKLGVALNSFNVSLSENNEMLQTNYTLTEFANTRLQITDADDVVLYKSDRQTNTSGESVLSWNRIINNNEQIAPGNYKLTLQIQSLYDEGIITQDAAFYLPLYYHIICGEEDATPAIQKISGSANTINGASVTESSDKVEYKINGLNPQSEYKISARFLNLANEERVQEIWIDGMLIGQPFEVTSSSNKTGFLDIPVELFSDGEINIRILRSGAGAVVVADIWLSESGTEFTFADPQQLSPTNYQLSQNYPNPFNPETTISYYLLDNSEVSLKVYDVTGREVAALVNGFQNAGKYNVVFNAASLSSGIYFYKLQTRSFTQTRKMVLLK